MKRAIDLGGGKRRENDRLGYLLAEGDDDARDAIHVAIVAVTAVTPLAPGQRVWLAAGHADRVTGLPPSPGAESIGVVDPFLSELVMTGERCWLLLRPNTITSLRHDWTHPAFAEAEAQAAKPTAGIGVSLVELSQNWLHGVAVDLGIEYDDLLRAADDWVESRSYTTERGSESWREGFNQYLPEFWEHYTMATNRPGPGGIDAGDNFFSCSC